MKLLNEADFLRTIENIRTKLSLSMSDLASLIPGETKQNYWKKATGKTAIKLDYARNLTKVLPIELILRKGNLYIKTIEQEEDNFMLNNNALLNDKIEIVEDLGNGFKVVKIYTTIHGRDNNEIFLTEEEVLKKYTACCAIPCYCLYDSNWNAFCENNLTKHSSIDSALKVFNDCFNKNLNFISQCEEYDFTLKDKENILNYCSYEKIFSSMDDWHIIGSLSEDSVNEEFEWLYGYGDMVSFLVDKINELNYNIPIVEDEEEQWDICKRYLTYEQKKTILEDNGYLIPLQSGEILFVWK